MRVVEKVSRLCIKLLFASARPAWWNCEISTIYVL